MRWGGSCTIPLLSREDACNLMKHLPGFIEEIMAFKTLLQLLTSGQPEGSFGLAVVRMLETRGRVFHYDLFQVGFLVTNILGHERVMESSEASSLVESLEGLIRDSHRALAALHAAQEAYSNMFTAYPNSDRREELDNKCRGQLRIWLERAEGYRKVAANIKGSAWLGLSEPPSDIRGLNRGEEKNS